MQAPRLIPDSRICGVCLEKRPESGWRPWHFPRQPSLYGGSLNAGSYTPLITQVCCLARIENSVVHFCRVLSPEVVSSQYRHAPRAPLPAKGITLLQRGVSHRVGKRYPPFIAHTGSCARPDSSSRLRFNYCVRYLQVVTSPCWKMALPGIISAILVWALGPLPRSAPPVLLLASSRRATASHPTSHVRRAENTPYNATSTRISFSRLQPFSNVQAPTLASPPGCAYR
jgi:hypothetical protein